MSMLSDSHSRLPTRWYASHRCRATRLHVIESKQQAAFILCVEVSAADQAESANRIVGLRAVAPLALMSSSKNLTSPHTKTAR